MIGCTKEKEMKTKKARRLLSGLIVMVLVLLMHLPAGNCQRQEQNGKVEQQRH